jgi:hypothetical protein
MMFKSMFHSGIVDGSINLTYRAWKRPQAKVGNRYFIHPIGDIRVTAIDQDVDEISDQDLARSGFDNENVMRKAMRAGAASVIYRIEFEFMGLRGADGPLLRETVPGADELADLHTRLLAKDARTGQAWTAQMLTMISASPGTSAGVLARQVDRERLKFKADVRKLKALGLTISLETGYRLSVRGEAYLAYLQELSAQSPR